MKKPQEIFSFIWKVCDDDLRGLFRPHEYGDIILPFIVLRRLDCLIEPKKEEAIELYESLKGKVDDPSDIIKNKIGLNFYNVSNYDLKKLSEESKSAKLNFNNYLNGFSQNVSEIIENFQLEKPVDKLVKNNKLFLFITKFTEIDLHPDVVDNHTMGSIFEELLRRFSEMSNETSGEHYTPRDVVELLVSAVFIGDKDELKGKGVARSIFDPCCGTGGMLTIGKEWVQENISEKVIFDLYGQELNPQTFSICKSDFLITGEDPEKIKLGSSLSNDKFQGMKFDYLISNPPYGVSWKSEQDFVKNEAKSSNGRFSVGTPRVNDGSLLFLQHMISKMNPDGARIGIVFNGSPLFTGDAGSGESDIRKWIIENDWLEAIIGLPNQLFFNTGISTYIWILNNDKDKERKGKIQLIDGTKHYNKMKSSLGDKRHYLDKSHIKELLEIYQKFEESDISQIHNNEFFGYTKVTIEQPEKDKNGELVKDKKGNKKADTKLRDYERIPLSEDIKEYFEREVKPHLPDAWMNKKKNKVGYEINFSKYFYKYEPLRSLEEITKDLLELDKESENLLNKIVEEDEKV